MGSIVDAAVKTYIDAASERDPEKRAAMLDACFAADGRVVSRSREIRGRAAVADEIAKLLEDPLLVRVRVLSVIDTGNTTFRFRSVVERSDGKNFEFFDAGEVDPAGRISLLLTFAGPLRDAADA
ncbi:nuclear transport factor 2 family protein [Sorangium sp. So ce1335]|uniref:nuclear transport factor 2 family protein n=1 Tax=Sorangium sp. So ce1335 TaxID=3133335 RepID=UPI003F602AEF